MIDNLFYMELQNDLKEVGCTYKEFYEKIYKDFRQLEKRFIEKSPRVCFSYPEYRGVIPASGEIKVAGRNFYVIEEKDRTITVSESPLKIKDKVAHIIAKYLAMLISHITDILDGEPHKWFWNEGIAILDEEGYELYMGVREILQGDDASINIDFYEDCGKINFAITTYSNEISNEKKQKLKKLFEGKKDYVYVYYDD